MKKSTAILVFSVCSLLHYGCQFFFWGLAELIPQPGNETIRLLGRMGFSVLSFPLLYLPSHALMIRGFDLFPILSVANSLLWGAVASIVIGRMMTSRTTRH